MGREKHLLRIHAAQILDQVLPGVYTVSLGAFSLWALLSSNGKKKLDTLNGVFHREYSVKAVMSARLELSMLYIYSYSDIMSIL